MLLKTGRRTYKDQGFTLIEVLLVVAIIVILAGIVIITVVAPGAENSKTISVTR